MDGIPARRSIIEPTTVASFVPLKYSPLNKAIDSENGIQNKSASNEVINVPAIKGNAPNLSFTESHSVDPINPKNPNSENALMLFDTNA